MGVLSPAYFQSRKVILDWVNHLLGLSYEKIEQTASGIAACHVFDALFPGMVKLEKVNFRAQRDFEYIVNYKILQAAFSRIGIEKQIDVERLIKGKYQDNLEFMQWVKGFFDSHASEEAVAYDGAARRRDLGKTVPSGGSRARVAGRAPNTGTAKTSAALRENRRGAVNNASSLRGGSRTGPVKRPGSPKVSKADYDTIKSEVAELQLAVEEGENERDFYFNKLRSVEMVIQGVEENGDELSEPMQQIKAVLYDTENNDPEEEEGAEQGEGETGDAQEYAPEEEYAPEGEYEEEAKEALADATAA